MPPTEDRTTNPQALIPVFDYFATLIVEPRPGKPWALDVRGEPWLFATEGRFLVGVRGALDQGEPPPAKVVSGCTHYLTDRLEDARVLPLARVVAFAGGAVLPRDVPCDACGGSGRADAEYSIECEHCHAYTRPACGACGGDGGGSLSLSVKYGRIVDRAPINLTYLAYALTLVPPQETVTVGRIAAGSSGSHTALAVEGDDWRIVIMSVRADAGPVAQFVPDLQSSRRSHRGSHRGTRPAIGVPGDRSRGKVVS